jgi:hypothetical protein
LQQQRQRFCFHPDRVNRTADGKFLAVRFLLRHVPIDITPAKVIDAGEPD